MRNKLEKIGKECETMTFKEKSADLIDYLKMPIRCSSLPTVVDFDNASIVQSDVAGPLHHTQSEAN